MMGKPKVTLKQKCESLEAQVSELQSRLEDLTRFYTGGVSEISKERLRQVEEEGWTASNDYFLGDFDLAKAAAAYTCSAFGYQDAVRFWPWHEIYFKPKCAESDLIRAGALIAAQLDKMASKGYLDPMEGE